MEKFRNAVNAQCSHCTHRRHYRIRLHCSVATFLVSFSKISYAGTQEVDVSRIRVRVGVCAVYAHTESYISTAKEDER